MQSTVCSCCCSFLFFFCCVSILNALYHTTPRHATPRHATPRHATPRHATPRHTTPRHATPRHATHHATPHHTTPRHATPHHTNCCPQLQCLFVGCLTSQQHASVSQGRICTDNFTCCHTEIEAADPTFHLTQSQYTDIGPTSPSADPITPGAWQGSHWSAKF